MGEFFSNLVSALVRVEFNRLGNCGPVISNSSNALQVYSEILEARGVLEFRKGPNMLNHPLGSRNDISKSDAFILLQSNAGIFTLSGCEDKVSSLQFRSGFVTR